MAKSVEKTDVQSEQEKLMRRRKIFGFTSNKFGRVVLCNLERFESMNKNNDTLPDENGMTETYARLSDVEYKICEKAVKTGKEADKKKANEIIVEKVQTLSNFMKKYKNEEITDKSTGLSPEVLELLAEVEFVNADDLKTENDALKAEIAELKKAKKAPATKTKAPAKKKEEAKKDEVEEETAPEADTDEAPKNEAPAENTDAEDDPFKD